MGVIAGSFVRSRQLDRNLPQLLVSQLSGKVVQINDEGCRLFRDYCEELVNLDLRKLLPVDLPPTSGAGPGALKHPGRSGKWVNHTSAMIRGHLRSFDITWRPIQLGWISYWILTLKETRASLNDPVNDNLFEAIQDNPLQTFRMPGNMRISHNWQFISFHRPAGYQGGDILSIEEISPDYLLYFLGDVAGHHKGAEIARMMLTSYLRIFREDFNSDRPENFPSTLLGRINNALCQDDRNDSLLTALVILLEKRGNIASFASAGHQPMIVVNPLKGRITLTSPDIPLGIYPRRKYRTMQVSFEPEDRLLCYTDGLISSGPTAGFRAGLNNLLKTLECDRETAPDDLTERLQRFRLQQDRNSTVGMNDVTFTVISRDTGSAGSNGHPAQFN